MNTVLAVAANGVDGQPLKLPHLEYAAIFPQLLLIGGALLLLLLASMFQEKADARINAFFTVIIGAASIGSVRFLWTDLGTGPARSAFNGAIVYDRFTLFFAVVIGSAVVLSSLIAGDWMHRRGLKGPELHVLIMLSAAGGLMMASANDLIVVFVGLEILSIALYVLVGFHRRSDGSREAAMKYFILGAFSSAIFLYGIALIYGATGTTRLASVTMSDGRVLPGIAKTLADTILIHNGLLLAGLVLLAVGFAFKIGAVPFHQWTPDVYQGAPTPITGFMAAASKAAAFAALIRIFISTFYTLRLDWQPFILALAILSLVVGSLVACVQQNVKRMLAYSSISHAGYILLGLQAATRDGVGGALFYILTYTFIVIGSFAIVMLVGGQSEARRGMEAFRGLGRRQPALALTFTVLLLAQAGVPLTSGFLAKFYVIYALVENGSYATAVFAMVIAAIAAFFYLRLVVVMYSTADSTEPVLGAESGSGSAVVNADGTIATIPRIELPAATWLALGIAMVFTVGFGIMPNHFINGIEFARRATADLFTSTVG